MKKTITYMWREAPEIVGDKIYRFQTTDPIIHKRLRRRKDFKLSIVGINKPIWIYKTRKHSLKEAKNTLQNISNGQLVYDETDKIYYCHTRKCLTEKEAA
tara:strand:+ start:235 stop:534 length:300 start_codon:yes stop_codon:yes gene_type:complete